MSNTVATTIRDQIVAQDKMAMWAWGAKDLVAHSNGLSFKSSGLFGKALCLFNTTKVPMTTL